MTGKRGQGGFDSGVGRIGNAEGLFPWGKVTPEWFEMSGCEAKPL